MLKTTQIPTRLRRDMEHRGVTVVTTRKKMSGRAGRVFIHMLLLLVKLGWRKVTRRLDATQIGEELRGFCQENGVLWIKIGQLVSMRADLFSDPVRSELSRLQDRADGFPGHEAREMVERELGVPIDRYFELFEEKPFAAASIAQVHRGKLRHEQVWVAIKVQRPDANEICRRDLVFIRQLVHFLEFIHFKPHARWSDMLWEVEQAVTEELDYRYESSNIRRLKKSLRKHHVYVPDVYMPYCTSRVLVMEFVQGVLMSDYLAMDHDDPKHVQAWRVQNHMVPARVARKLLFSFLRQVFEDNMFHGDLHPGNIVLLRSSQVAFIDFGTLGTLETDFQSRVEIFVQALSDRQYSKAIDLFFMFSHDLPSTDLMECKNEMIRSLQAWDERSRVASIPFSEKSLNGAMDKLAQIGGRYSVSTVWSFFRMTRALATMDSSLADLMPDANFHQLVDEYFYQRANRLGRELAKPTLDDLPNPRELAALQRGFFEDILYRGSIIRRTAQVFEESTSAVSQFASHVFALLAGGLGLLAFYFLFMLIYRKIEVVKKLVDNVWARFSSEPIPLVPVVEDLQLFLLIFVALFYVINRCRYLQRVFASDSHGG